MRDDLRWRAVEQMANLEGWPNPPEIGGRVDNPAFILHCGDYFDGDELELAAYLHCMRQLSIPSYETLGNHDDIGNPVARDYFLKKFGGRYYAFKHSGVHIISLYKPRGILDDVPPMDDGQLAWLEKEFAAIGPDKPVVIFGHGRPNDLPNADEFDAVLGKANVVLMFSAHTHLWRVTGAVMYHSWQGRSGVIAGALPRPLGRSRLRPHVRRRANHGQSGGRRAVAVGPGGVGPPPGMGRRSARARRR